MRDHRDGQDPAPKPLDIGRIRKTIALIEADMLARTGTAPGYGKRVTDGGARTRTTTVKAAARRRRKIAAASRRANRPRR